MKMATALLLNSFFYFLNQNTLREINKMNKIIIIIISGHNKSGRL